MKITKADIEKLLKEMEDTGVNEVEIDAPYNPTVDSIEFDAWKNGHYIKTLLTIEEE